MAGQASAIIWFFGAHAQRGLRQALGGPAGAVQDCEAERNGGGFAVRVASGRSKGTLSAVFQKDSIGIRAGLDGAPGHWHTLPMSRALAFAGCAGWLVVVLTHIAERFQLLPHMDWGLPNSPRHYLDLFSTIAGVMFLLAAFVLRYNHSR